MTAHSESNRKSELSNRGSFATTHWSVILAAANGQSERAFEALEKFCRTYWYPIYGCIRRRGYGAEDAKDLTQEFFARHLERNFLNQVDQSKGKFRSFLLASLNHFLCKEWNRAKAVKRGGRQLLVSLDDKKAETRYLREPVSDSSPEKIFERRWAEALFDHALARLRDEFKEAGKENLFDRLEMFLAEESRAGDYAALGAELEMSAGAVAVAVHRLRQKYRELVYQEIARTVSSVGEVENEMKYLLRVIRG